MGWGDPYYFDERNGYYPGSSSVFANPLLRPLV